MGDTVVQVGSSLRVVAPSDWLVEALHRKLTYPNPDKRRRRWDPKWSAYVVGPDGSITIPRGAVSHVRAAARAAGVSLRWESHVVTEPGPRVPIASLGRQPRLYQAEAVDAMIQGVQGTLELPCGGGKTTVAGIAVSTLAEPTAVLVHSHDLVDQWVETFRTITGRPARVFGRDDRGPLRRGDVVVGMVQAMVDRDHAIPILGSAGCVVVDEAHHAPARSWTWCLDRTPARYRWGLTATPERADGWDILLPLSFGPTLYRRTELDLIALGWLHAPIVIPVASGWSPSQKHFVYLVKCEACAKTNEIPGEKWVEGDRFACKGMVKKTRCPETFTMNSRTAHRRIDHTAAMSDLSADPGRQAIVDALAAWGCERGGQTLALLPRVSAAREMSGRMRRYDAVHAVSSMSAGARAESLTRIRSGRARMLCATQLADEGLDVPALDCLVMANPGKSGGRYRQRVGRVCRPVGGRPIVFDVVDGGEFGRLWRRRSAAIVAAFGAGAVPDDRPVDLASALALASAWSASWSEARF